MIIQRIYDTYRIPPHLQLHMLRVAGVCKLICDHWKGADIDTNSLMQATLLHDIGNIVKFTYDNPVSQKLLEGVDIDDIKKIHAEMVKKYGTDDHMANILICEELGVPKDTIGLVDAVDFLSLHYLDTKEDMEKILMIYCDLRVGPFGVITTHERLAEAAQRYKKQERVSRLDQSYKLSDAHEKIIFDHCSISPQDITDETINPLIEDLRSYVILSGGE